MYSVSLANYDLNGTNPNSTLSNITLGAFGQYNAPTEENNVMPELLLTSNGIGS